MQNLLTTQQPEGTHNTDLHGLQKNISLTTIWLEQSQIGKSNFPNKHMWDISIYQIKCLWEPAICYPSILIPLNHTVFI